MSIKEQLLDHRRALMYTASQQLCEERKCLHERFQNNLKLAKQRARDDLQRLIDETESALAQEVITDPSRLLDSHAEVIRNHKREMATITITYDLAVEDWNQRYDSLCNEYKDVCVDDRSGGRG